MSTYTPSKHLRRGSAVGHVVPGALGTVGEVATGRGLSSTMPGPRGGLVYVDWDDGHCEGVFRADLTAAKSGKRVKAARVGMRVLFAPTAAAMTLYRNPAAATRSPGANPTAAPTRVEVYKWASPTLGRRGRTAFPWAVSCTGPGCRVKPAYHATREAAYAAGCDQAQALAARLHQPVELVGWSAAGDSKVVQRRTFSPWQVRTANPQRHIPAPGRASGRSGMALCGRRAQFSTGDHALIRRLAASGGEHWCQDCLRRLRRAPKPAQVEASDIVRESWQGRYSRYDREGQFTTYRDGRTTFTWMDRAGEHTETVMPARKANPLSETRRAANPVQSWAFPKAAWTKQESRAWLKRHKQKAPKAEETKGMWRYRQLPPVFERYASKYIQASKGPILMILGWEAGDK